MPIPHRPTRAHAIAALAVTAAAVLAGCGSDDSEPAPVTTATATPGGTATSAEPAAPAAVTVTVEDMAFSPDNVTVRVGDTVTWEFADSVPHSVQGIGDKAMGINSPILTSGEWSYTFTVPGEFRYLCTLHPEMRGTVTVE